MTEPESEPTEPTFMKVSELGPRSRSVNLKLKTLSKNEVREVSSRRDGSTHKVTEIMVGDDTGVVLLTLWDDMIETTEENKFYTLTNGYTSLFQGNIRLNIGRYGKLEDLDEKPFKQVNEEENISDKKFEQPRFRRDSWRSGGGRPGGRYGGRGGGGRDRRRY